MVSVHFSPLQVRFLVVCSVYIVWKLNRTFEVFYYGKYGNLIITLLRDCWIFLLRAEANCLLLLQTIFASCVFPVVCGHRNFCSVISVVSQWPDKDFLKYLAPKRGKKTKQHAHTGSLNSLKDASAPKSWSNDGQHEGSVIESSNQQPEHTVQDWMTEESLSCILAPVSHPRNARECPQTTSWQLLEWEMGMVPATMQNTEV